jgi:hypothetical protein
MNRNLAAVLLATLCATASAAPADGLRISGPFTYENLSLYLLHAPGKQAATNLLTLREAIEQKKAAVYETGNVQQLSIENLANQPVFVQAGDIVKGGRQDRVLTTDLLLPPHSGRLPIASFCVEQGRWTKRGAESADQFNAATAAVPTRELKMAVREPGNQANVWRNVAEARVKLSAVASGARGTFSAPGATSMQMALEDRKVTEAVDRYISALSKAVDGAGDIVGYAYTVNGKFSGAEVYGSGDLFRRSWPKLLHASSAEALAERSNTAGPKPLDPAAIRKALAGADTGRAGTARNNGALVVSKRESDQSVLYVTAEREPEGRWLHKSYIAK